ncbi:F-box/WD repeat-containing protein [Phanerochaete sordida]|uniref:F-box/WD repeat-containing protein n=1 Tax=Phanerochaete sordida TaxID=48140 RepID=A0A9P3GEP7_9APHY|nr:F-box/WD repeat-containing protein [Phanerochaete sordida]
MVLSAIVDDEAAAESSPRFNRLLSSVLGSPFITTSDLPPSDFSLIRRINAGADLETVDGALAAVPRAETVTRPASPTPSFATDTYSLINWTADVDWASAQPRPSFSDAAPGCSLLPSGSRRSMPPYAYSYSAAPTPFNSLRISHSNSTSYKGSRNFNLLPRLWEVLRESSPAKKGKRRFDAATQDLWGEFDGSGYIDYAKLPPLDGEEGELIDDEACFIDVRAVTGLDIIANIPDELALHLLSFLDLPDVVACMRVSRTWGRLASDNAVWRSLFARKRSDGWLLDLRRLKYPALSKSKAILPKADLATSRAFEIPAPLRLDWYSLYKNRAELDRRWSANPFPGRGEDKENAVAWAPRKREMGGQGMKHADSVYCLEFDSSRIITGSRDRTIKIWSVKTGRCLLTITGHQGSVLCLRFERDFDLDDANAVPEGQGWHRGTMVSGSSDCSVIVWDLYSYPVTDEGDEEFVIAAKVRGHLRGHTGGVLDLRIENKWIISCGKDASVLVWDRATMTLHRAFRGHEGPVNAVGVEGDRLASASGDGKMMLWDMSTGERIRTFDAHDRGLACIEFKGDLIISGSNDCKIKVWSAATGECLRTLHGHSMLVRTLSYDPASGRLVSGSYDRSIKVWDVATGKVVRDFPRVHESHIFDIKFNCCRIVSVSHDHRIIVHDFDHDLDAALFV